MTAASNTLPTTLEVRHRVIREVGVTLPYVRGDEKGTVFVSYDFLEALSEQGAWLSQYGHVLICHDSRIEAALSALGFLVKETKGGVHGTPKLQDWLADVKRPKT